MTKKFLVFIAFCFGISLLASSAFHFGGGVYTSIWGTLFATGYMFIPMVAVVITQLVCGEKPFSGCGIGFRLNWWWLAAILGITLFCIVVVPVSALVPGVDITLQSSAMTQTVEALSKQGLPIGPWGVLAISFVSGLLAGCTVNALFAFGEEVAWRGFLERLLRPLGFWKESLAIGAVWGIWHAPVILMGHNYPGHPVAGVFMMVAFCLLLSPVFMYVRERSKSVVAAALAHGTMNATAGLSLMLLSGYDDLLCGPTGLAGLSVLLLLDVALYIRPGNS